MAFISKGRIIYLQTDLPIHFVPANSTFAWRLQPVHVINQPLRLPAAGMTIDILIRNENFEVQSENGQTGLS